MIRVGIGIIMENDHILGFRRVGEPFDGYYEFPGGKVEVGEAVPDAIIREIYEELGVAVEIDTFIDSITYDYPNFTVCIDAYYVKIVEGEIVLNVHNDMQWFNGDTMHDVRWLDATYAILNKIMK